jgi:hypothetical protein
MVNKMTNFAKPFSRIKDISDRRRLPRLGKIRLGVKAVSKKTGKEYPKETEYFVCPEEVRKIYGDQPKELDVMFPLNEVEAIFPQRYVWYGQSRGAKCIGDGERANRVQEDQTVREIECPCDKLGKECQRRAHLMVILPKVSLGGVYQIDLGSYHSIIDLNSGLDYVQALVGRFSMVPLVLKRVPKETHGSGRKETHWPLQVIFEGSVEFINALRETSNRILTASQYLLPAPIEENPATDEGAIVVEETEEQEEIKPEEQKLGNIISNVPSTTSHDPIKEPREEEKSSWRPDRPEHIAEVVKDVFPGAKTIDPEAEMKVEELFGDLQTELISLESQTDIMMFMTIKVKKHQETLGEKRYQSLVNAVNARLIEVARKHRKT